VLPPVGTSIPAPQPVGQISPPNVVTSTASAPAPTEGVDKDMDTLTDVEERLFGTDAQAADTDQDGFADGAEVLNLFDPVSKGQSLTKNLRITPVQWNGWSMLVPKSWNIATAGEEPSFGLIATESSAQFTLQARANATRQTLSQWIGAAGNQMKTLKTKNGLDALQSADGLITYLAVGDTVLVVQYDLQKDASYEYRMSYALIVQSLRAAQR